MSAIPSMFEAALGPVTELTCEHEIVRSPGNCGTLEPRWWVVDIGVRARVVDTSAGPVRRPEPSAFLKPEYVSRAPLHIRLRAGLLDGRSSSGREWLIDATSMRAYLFASSITAYVVGPTSLHPYHEGGGASMTAVRDVFCLFRAGIWPADTMYQHTGVPGHVARGCSCSIRVDVGMDEPNVAVPIPPGARSLMIFDALSPSSAWTWQLGDPAVEQRGRIPVSDGQSPEVALVPNFSHVAPLGREDQEREALLVFGVDL